MMTRHEIFPLETGYLVRLASGAMVVVDSIEAAHERIARWNDMQRAHNCPVCDEVLVRKA